MTAIESTAAQPATSNINNTTISSSSPKQSISDETGRTPEEFTQLGLWEVEPLYYSLSSSKNGGGGGGYTTSGESGRKKRGKAFKSRAEGEYKCFEAHDGAVYRPGDHVFVEISQTEPYVIGSINMFKMAKRDQLSIKITRYYRPDDVPEISYSLIIQERKEQGHYETTRELQVRELFSSETTTVHPISALRGKCSVKVVKDIRSVAETDLKEPDSFFSCLNFNLESSRLASVQGEIRVGPSHQAKVPQLPSSSISDEPDRDELLYRPGQLCEETEQHYVRMARTFRTFALMKNDRITSLEKNARTGDLVMDDAIVTLHRCGYNTSEAISVMNSSDQLLSTDSSFMSADDVKKFGKGIKTHGKNFFKINREILPYHPREQLVGFYYLWKKSSEATRPKPLARTRAAVANTGKRGGRTGVNATVRNSRPESTELVDYASASETDTEQMEQDGRPNYACHHCYSSKSRDWHHAGKDRQLMCTDCRLFYKKYGQLRPVDRPSTVPPCLFKSARNSPSGSLNGEIEEETGVKTRATKFKERKRTPSVADMLDRTPSKLTDSDGFTPEKRSTPLRNAAKSRKRNNNKTSDENTPAKRRLKTEPTTPEESPAKSEGQPTKQEDVKPSTSAPSSPTVKPSTSPKPLSNGVLPISASAPHLSSKKPIAKVEPLDTSGYNHDEKMQIDEKPSTSTAHSPVEKENQPIKEEILEELDKKQPVDEDDGDFSEAFEKEDQETREISDDRKYSKSTHQYINIENDADAQGREKLKALEKVPGYHLVQTVKFKSVRTCARTYLSYTPEEPEFWKKRKERKEEKKQQQQQQQLNNLNKPQQQQPTQNPVAILPNPNLARPAQVTAPGNLLQKTPTQELPQNADINTTLQAAFMNQLHAQSRIPMSSAQMLPPPGTPIPGFQPMPSMSPFDPRYALGGFPNNQMQMMMMWQQQMEQQKQAEALRHHQLNGMLNGNHAQNTQANAVNANKPNPPTNVVSPMDQQRLAALSLFNQNPSSFQNPLAALAAMQNDQQQQQLAASQALAMLNERAAQQHQQRSIQDRIQMEILQQQQQQQNQAQQQQQNHMQHPTPNQPATAALAAVAQQAQQTQQSQQNQQQQHLLNGSIPQEVLHLLLQQQQHQAQAQAQAAAVQQAQAVAAHQQQQQQQQAQQQAMAALATAMGLGVNPAAMQHNNLMLDMLRNVGQIPGLAAHFNAAAHTPRS